MDRGPAKLMVLTVLLRLATITPQADLEGLTLGGFGRPFLCAKLSQGLAFRACGRCPPMLMRTPLRWVRPKRLQPPCFIVPCQPTLASKVPAGGGWIHELKHDGFRRPEGRGHVGAMAGSPLSERRSGRPSKLD